MTTAQSSRLAALSASLAEACLDAVLVTPGSDLRYLTGNAVHPSERLTCLVVTAEGTPTLICPVLEAPRAEMNAAEVGIAVHPWDETDDPYALVAGEVGNGARRVAISDRAWFAQSWSVQAVLPDAVLVPASPLLGKLRLIKTAEEVSALRLVAQGIDRVHERMGEWLRPGRTELEVVRDIADAIVAEGHESVDFVIVASGPNGASPHHQSGARLITAGDLVVVDIGGSSAQGYRSDCTRTYAITWVAEEARGAYSVLRRAQQAGLDAVRPGVTCEAVDAAAREIIATAGWGPQFTHRTGHGIGLDGHEDPYIVSGNRTALVAGMAFSVEPGIYLNGRFGMRIEDVVVCTVDRGDVLNKCDKTLRVLG